MGLMYVIVFYIVAVVLVTLFQDIPIGAYGANKTVGWAWDICSILPGMVMLSFIVYVIGYLILMFCRAKINKVISILNFAFLLASICFLFFWKWDVTCIIFLGITVLSLMMLLANVGVAIGSAIKRNKHA